MYVRNCEIEHVRLEDVTSWFSLQQELKWQHNTFIPKAQALRKLFEFYKMQGFLVLEPKLIPMPSKQYNLPRVATEEMYRKLIAAVPVDSRDPRHIRNRAILMLLWDTGARNGEIMSLKIDEINTQTLRAVIKTEKSKGSRPFREIFWTEETNEAIKAWIKKREELKKKTMPYMSDALFVSVCSSRTMGTNGKQLSIRGVGELLRRYCIRAKMPYVNAHSFRHHMGHDIITQGGSAADVMNILGHATLSSSSIYTMMTGQELENRYRTFKGK
jgi:integrase/recombinase XerC